jgi:hypothetical protein
MFNTMAACLIIFLGWIFMFSITELLLYLRRLAS